MHRDNNSNAPDDVTGLAAFDDLDPVSAVSELNLMPEDEVTAAPPPRPHVSTLPPGGMRAMSAPPPPPPSTRPESSIQYDPGPQQPDPSTQYGFDEEDEHTQHYEGAHAGAALDMDWDEEELETRLRDEVPNLGEPAPAAMNSVAPMPGGNPSPFAAAPPTSLAPTAVGAPSPFDGGAVREDTAVGQWPDQHSGPNKVGLAISMLLVALVALFAVWIFGSDKPGVATLVTQPADTEVTVDGVKLASNHSPFILELTADEEHEVVVSRDGYEPQTFSVEVESGKRENLPPVQLKSTGMETGFALNSSPAGARVLVDGADTGKTTPARITGIDEGMHTIRLEDGEGEKAFELQVFVVQNKLLELPDATLTPVHAAAESAEPVAGEKPSAKEESAEDAEAAAAREERRAARRERRAARRVQARPKSFSAAKRVPKANVSSASGTGVLRINSRPWSTVTVDGKRVGNTPLLNLKLSAGRHTVKLVNSQMGLSKTIKVTIKSGETTTQVLNLVE